MRSRQRHPTRGLTEGAILAALTVIVGAAGLVIPPAGILLAPLPIMLVVIRWGVRTAVLASVVAGLILFQFFGPLNALSIVAAFAPLGLGLGWGVRRTLGAQFTVLVGAAAFLASIVAMFSVATFLLHQDLVGQFVRSQVQAMQTALAIQQRLGASHQQTEELRQFITVLPQMVRTLIPVALPLGALLWAYLSYTTARTVLRRVGHELPGMPPILSWRLSPVLASVLLWLSAGLSLVSLRVPVVRGAALDAMFVNVFVFGFQGALVGITWMNRRHLSRFAQVMVGLLIFTAGYLPLVALAVLGMMDTWFDYRRIAAGPAAPSEPPSGSGDGGTPVTGGPAVLPAAGTSDDRTGRRGGKRKNAFKPVRSP